jgi:hypothetical protein
MAVCCWESTMDIASVFDWFAQESTSAAEHTDEPRQRDMWIRLAKLWATAAQRCRDETATLRPGSQSISTSN